MSGYRRNIGTPGPGGTPGLIDWTAGSRGTSDAIAIESAKARMGQMAEETRGLLMKNALNDMTLKEQAIHHGAWMKANKDGQLEARMKKSMALEDAKLDMQLIEADRIKRQSQKQTLDYIQMQDHSDLIAVARKAINDNNAANALGALTAINEAMPTNNNPELLGLTRQLKDMSDQAIQGIFDASKQVESEDPSPDGTMRGIETLVRESNNFVDQADPAFRQIVGQTLHSRVKNIEEGTARRNAAVWRQKINAYRNQTGATEHEAALALKNEERMRWLGLDGADDKLENTRRAMAVRNGQEKIALDWAEGTNEGREAVDQRKISKQLALVSSLKDEVEASGAEQMVELNKLEGLMTDQGLPASLGNMTLAQLMEIKFWNKPLSTSDVQDQIRLTIKDRMNEITDKMQRSDTAHYKMYQEKLRKLDSLYAEVGFWSGFHNTPKEYEAETKKFKAHMTRFYANTHGPFDNNKAEAIDDFRTITQYLDGIYKLDSDLKMQIDYRRLSIQQQNAEFQQIVNGLARQVTPGAAAAAPTEIQEP